MTAVATEPRTISADEVEQVERANATTATPVVFVDGVTKFSGR